MAKENPQKLLLWQPAKGGIVSDVDVLDMREGNLFLTEPYTGAVDIRAIGAGTNISPSYEAVQSTKYSYKPTEQLLQNRVIRITISSETAGNYRYSFYNGNGVLIVSTGNLAVTAGNLTATYNTIAAGIAAALVAPQTYVISALTTTSTDNGYFEIEITTVSGWDYSVRNFSTTVIQSEFIIIQEAISGDMLGDWKPLGSNDQTGDLFHFWTTRRTSTTFDVLGATNNGAGLIRITVASTATLTDLHAVSITGVEGTTEANGSWIINVISATTFDLLGSAFANAYTGGGTVTDHPFGLGEIGVAVKNENNQTWLYTRLLRSKEFNFITSNQIDCRAKRKQDGNIAVYFVQGHGLPKNPPRVFYYKQPYITDGALTINGGIYEYGNILNELILFVRANGFFIDYIDTIQSGGGVLSGNWRYAASFGINGNFTDWTELTNPVNVYTEAEGSSPYDISGNPDATPTSKQNILRITLGALDIFDEVRIAAINYLDTGFNGVILDTYKLNNTLTQDIVHTGKELNETDIPGGVGAIQQVSNVVDTAQNVELHDNRQMLSNLTVRQVTDFTSFTQTWTHSVLKKTITGVRNAAGVGTSALRFGEYQDPDNVYNNCGYMINETYALGAKFVMKSGFVTPIFHIQDITINTDAAFPRRVAALADGDLSNTTMTEVYVPYIQFSGINANAIIDGVPFHTLVDYIIIERMECVREVLFTCVGVLGVNGLNQDCTSGVSCETVYYSDTSAGASRIGEYPWSCGRNPTSLGNFPTLNPVYPGGFASQAQYIALYSSDIFLAHIGYGFLAGDQLFNYGCPSVDIGAYVPALCPGLPSAALDGWTRNQFTQYTGNFGAAALQSLTITDGIFLDFDQGGTVNGNLYDKRYWTQRDLAPAGMLNHLQHAHESSPVVFTSAGAASATGFTNRGLMYMQYFRTSGTYDNTTGQASKYGALKDRKYVSTGARLQITSTTSSPTINVFGGDTFTQKNYFKKRLMITAPTCANGAIGDTNEVSWYAQNRVNAQMDFPPAGTTNLFPYGNNIVAWLNSYDRTYPEYTEGYTIRNQIQLYNAFDADADYQTDWRNAIIYSEIEVDGSNTDALRSFPPLNLRFQDYTNGVITNLLRLNDELICFQPRYTERLFFNTTATVTTEEGQPLILGGAPVFSYKGRSVTNWGCSHKWGMGKMMSDKGNDICIFLDEINRVICRIGFDGANSIDETHGIKSFIANNIRFVIGRDKPAHDMGVHTGVHQRFREMEMTFIGWKTGIEEWGNGVPEYIDLYDFNAPTGALPLGGVIQVSGLLYGMTTNGGANGTGVIYSYNISTNIFTVLHDFANATGESSGGNLLLASNGLLYGLTLSGGANNDGVLFSYNISTGIYTNLFDFGGGAGTAVQPQSTLIEVSGILYGTTAAGGANNTGTIFSYNIGTTTFTILHDFAITGGIGNELTNVGGVLYGTSFNGGATSEGELFSYDIASTTFTTIHDFTNATGSDPNTGVVHISGKLYGVTSAGGASNFGVLYEYDIIGLTYTVLHEFAGIGDGNLPSSSLLNINNVLYGVCLSGGLNNEGTIFSYNIGTATFSKLHDFTVLTGSLPACKLLLANNGIIYGTTGAGGANGDGVLFSFDVLSGVYQTGDVVSLDTIPFSQVPQFYISLIDNNINLIPNSNPDAWQIIPRTDNGFYSFFSLTWSEFKNKFQRFSTYCPPMYFKYRDGLLSARPITNFGEVYEHDIESYPIRFYDDGVSRQLANPFFDAVFVFQKEIKKSQRAMRYFSEKAPNRVEFTTKRQVSYLDFSEFRTREDEHDAPIKRDSTVTLVGVNGADANPLGLNSLRTSILEGKYLIVRTRLQNDEYNRVNEIGIKHTERARNPNT